MLVRYLDRELDAADAEEESDLSKHDLAHVCYTALCDTLAAFGTKDLAGTPVAPIRIELTEAHAGTLWEYCAQVLGILVDVPSTDGIEELTS